MPVSRVLIQSPSTSASNANGLQEFDMIELQGELETRPEREKLLNELQLGELRVLPATSSHDGAPQDSNQVELLIGRQILHGKRVKLPKPLTLTRKISADAASSGYDAQYEILGIIRSKVVFTHRPETMSPTTSPTSSPNGTVKAVADPSSPRSPVAPKTLFFQPKQSAQKASQKYDASSSGSKSQGAKYDSQQAAASAPAAKKGSITDFFKKKHRRENLARGFELLNAGQISAAQDFFQKAVDITPAMAYNVIKAAQLEGIECIVAPYEADAYMAYLAKTGYVDCVVTEDSDLVPYGSPRIFFKMDSYGNGVEFVARNLALNYALPFADFTRDMLITMCVLAGCDYLESLPSIGIKTAHRIVKDNRGIVAIIKALRIMAKGNMTAEYEAGLSRAIMTFKHYRVYDPIAKRIVCLEPLPQGMDPDEFEFLGADLDPKAARLVCSGKVDPVTYVPFEYLADEEEEEEEEEEQANDDVDARETPNHRMAALPFKAPKRFLGYSGEASAASSVPLPRPSQQASSAPISSLFYRYTTAAGFGLGRISAPAPTASLRYPSAAQRVTAPSIRSSSFSQHSQTLVRPYSSLSQARRSEMEEEEEARDGDNEEEEDDEKMGTSFSHPYEVDSEDSFSEEEEEVAPRTVAKKKIYTITYQRKRKQEAREEQEAASAATPLASAFGSLLPSDSSYSSSGSTGERPRKKLRLKCSSSFAAWKVDSQSSTSSTSDAETPQLPKVAPSVSVIDVPLEFDARSPVDEQEPQVLESSDATSSDVSAVQATVSVEAIEIVELAIQSTSAQVYDAMEIVEDVTYVAIIEQETVKPPRLGEDPAVVAEIVEIETQATTVEEAGPSSTSLRSPSRQVEQDKEVVVIEDDDDECDVQTVEPSTPVRTSLKSQSPVRSPATRSPRTSITDQDVIEIGDDDEYEFKPTQSKSSSVRSTPKSAKKKGGDTQLKLTIFSQF